jgi:hypothetical protein
MSRGSKHVFCPVSRIGQSTAHAFGDNEITAKKDTNVINTFFVIMLIPSNK